MNVYTVTAAFDQVPDNISLGIGDTIGKLESETECVVNSVSYTNDAFYVWVGSADALNYMAFTGNIPDPSSGGGVPTAPVTAPATSTSTGTQGTWAWDGTYMYWCRATNVWVRWVVVQSW
jgi:hypothetical protein